MRNLSLTLRRHATGCTAFQLILLLVWVLCSPICFGIQRQESLRRLRERDGSALTSSARELQDPLSPAGQRVLSKITESGEDWFAVRHLYSSYTGTEIQIFNSVMHAAVRCNQLKEGAQVYEKLCDLNITKTYPTFTAALKIFAELGETITVRKLWKEASRSLGLNPPLALARIDAAAVEGDVEMAAAVLDSLKQADINIAHITAAIRACWEANGTNWRAAEYLLNLAFTLDLQPDIATFSCLVGAYATAPLDKIESTYRTMQEIGLKPNRVFSEIYLTSVLATKKEEAYDLRTVRQLTSYLCSCPQDRLKAARAALDDFKNAKLETTIFCNKIDAALRLLEVEA
mmetsp:Transcript_5011/g.10199  ORF Transcript_5011/g.10199 Transcript_5011/m.10199 type:complete len:345 (-) Transcript_5011:87-1121(-)